MDKETLNFISALESDPPTSHEYMKKVEIRELIYKFQNLGIGSSSDGATLIGSAPFNGPKAWLNIMYPPLNEDEKILLEKELNTFIPEDYLKFLSSFSNGLNILSSTFSLYGLRRQINRDIEENVRQPYSIITPNIFERPDNAKDSYFFIGGYNWDGSHLYIDKETNKVHCCERWNAKSKMKWDNFEDMVLSEIKRLYTLFDEDGKEINDDIPTIPY